MGNNNSASKKTTPSETSLQSLPQCESLELFNTLQCLPDGMNSLKSVKRLSKKTLRERNEIIKKLRNMADQLAKTHSNVLIADRVGTGVGIGSGLLFIGGLAAAPKTFRAVAGAVAAAFIIIDVIHMVHICQETGETPTVQNLRKLANDLEKECQFIDETEESAESEESDGKKDK
jgi:hypothetical protein